jgi:hypothetical protein
MSSVADKLRGIVSEPVDLISGKVQSVVGNTAYISTPKGVITAATQGVQYAAGTEVRVKSGVVRGRIKKASSLPVYRV